MLTLVRRSGRYAPSIRFKRSKVKHVAKHEPQFPRLERLIRAQKGFALIEPIMDFFSMRVSKIRAGENVKRRVCQHASVPHSHAQSHAWLVLRILDRSYHYLCCLKSGRSRECCSLFSPSKGILKVMDSNHETSWRRFMKELFVRSPPA